MIHVDVVKQTFWPPWSRWRAEITDGTGKGYVGYGFTKRGAQDAVTAKFLADG